jgi:hypothetical protein
MARRRPTGGAPSTDHAALGMTDRHPINPFPGTGTKLVIAGAALAVTGVLSIAALVVQLLWYDPPCRPLVAWSFIGACGVLRLLVLLMLPTLALGLGLVGRGFVLRRRQVAG